MLVEKFTITIDESLCTNCGICVDSCPNHVLAINKGKIYVKNVSACNGCRTCVNSCLCNALSIQ